MSDVGSLVAPLRRLFSRYPGGHDSLRNPSRCLHAALYGALGKRCLFRQKPIGEFASRFSRSVPSYLCSKNAIDFKLIAEKTGSQKLLIFLLLCLFYVIHADE